MDSSAESSSVVGGRRGDLIERLRRSPVLGDGAMGSMLMSVGGKWTVPEELNFETPERVRAVHAAYVAAGSELVVTNSFGGSPAKLALVGLEAKAVECNRLAASLAREAAGEGVWVGGSIGPTGRFLEPLGDLTLAEAEAGFALQATALEAGGADLIVVETMSSLEEAAAAVQAAKYSCGLPVVCTMTFEATGRPGEFRTMMGVSVEQLLELVTLGADAIGVNCGQGPAAMLEVVQQIRALDSGVPLIAQPNAGAPRLEAGKAVYDVSPAVLGEFAARARDLGVALIGACCGSSPAHIQAMAEVLRS